MLNQRIVACWILVCSLFGELSYTTTNLMTEFIFKRYCGLQVLFYMCLAYSNFHVGSIALESQLCLPTFLWAFVKASTFKPLTDIYKYEKENQSFLLIEMCAQFAENRSWHYLMLILKQYTFFHNKRFIQPFFL